VPKINWHLIVWCAVFYWVWVTGPYWWQTWKESRAVCNPMVTASCEP
jgi:hypothetical protein